MLVLTRHTNESIEIDTPAGVISIVVIDSNRSRVRIGLTAPKEYNIVRSELRPKKEPADA